MLEGRCVPSVYLVTNPGDDITGATPNQLRSAINQVNTGAGTGDTINFSLGAPGAPQTITLSAALPAITKPVVINGWSQNGGTPGVMIGINGGGLTGDGLVFNTGGSTVGGLAVYNFHGNGIDLNNTSGSSKTGLMRSTSSQGTKAMASTSTEVRLTRSPGTGSELMERGPRPLGICWMA
jgi:hypothetical protein